MARKKKESPEKIIENSLSEVASMGIGGGAGIPWGFPGNQGTGWSAPVENANTVFKNLRWYLVSNFRQMLNQAYIEIGLVQTICDVPVDDALRGGVTVKSEQLDEEDIIELMSSLDRDDDLNKAGQTAKMEPVIRGAGVIIIVGDQDPETPLDVEAIDKDTPIEFRSADMWELTWDYQNANVYDPTLQFETEEFYSYYGVKVHKSRVIRMEGLTPPSFIRPRLRGWGFSVVEILVRSINQYLKGTDLAFEVLDEFKVDVYKIKNLTQTLMSPEGTEAVKRRVQIGNYQKNFQNALVMDTEDDWDHKQLSFTGISEAMLQIRMQVAADMRMPMTKLFGISAAGFNSGEDDIEVYNAMVESQVRNKIKYAILRMIEVKCQKLFGFIPDDLSIEFEPLRVMSSEQEENVKTQKFNRLIASLQAGIITPEEFRNACNKSQLFDITLEKDTTLEDGYMDRIASEQGGDDNEPDAKDKGGLPKGEKKTSDNKAPDAKDAPDEKKKTKPTQNEIKPYTTTERAKRAVSNSTAFDIAAYGSAGGDDWIDPRKAPLFKNPGDVDERLWAKAKGASRAAFGEERWQFITWWYKKHGGKFSHIERK